MADSTTAKKMARPGASFARRYGLAFGSVAGALLLELLFHHFNLPHPFAAFALSAIAITFWYAGTKPGIVAVLLSSLIRGYIFEAETSSLSRVLYELVFLIFAILMIWVRRKREALEVEVADRTTKLTAANEELRKEKEQLDALFELSPDAVILTDDDFHVLRVNKEFTRIFGYTAEEVAGRWLPELIMPEELRAEALKNRDRLISGDRVELETVRQRKDRVRLDVSVMAQGISLGLGQVAVYLIYRDITERKKAERELRRSEGYLAEAQKLTHTGSWAWNVRTGVLFWSREIFSIYDYEYQEMGLTWPQFLERIHPEDRPQIEQSARMEASGNEWLDSQNDFRIILPDGSIKHLHSVAHPVRDDSGEITEVVGTVMDVTEQWKARAELEKAFDEIKQRTEAARRSERELRVVVNTVPAHVWRTSPEGQVDFVNDRWVQFTGLALEEAFGWRWEAVVHPDDLARVVADWHTALKNGRAMESEARVRRADGEYCWWFMRNVPLRDETGKLVSWYGTAIDIEDRKRAEQALRRSEAYLAEAHRLAKTGSWAYSPAAEKCIYWSDEMLRIFGLDPQRSNLPDREEFLRLVHPEDRDRFNERIDKAFSEKADFVQDYRIVLTDGTVKHIHGIGHPVLDETGNIVEYVGTDADVTERKRAEEALQRSEGYLAEAQRLTHTGSWAAQVSQKENVYWSNVYWSKEMYRIFGLDPGPTPPSPMEVARRLHPEYAPDHPRVVERAIRGGTDFEIDHRLLLPDGTAKYVHVVGHPVLNASGDVTELIGTTMDVTEQHEARAALQAAFEKIKAEETELRRMTDAIASFIYVFRPDGTALYANQAVLDYTGLTLEEVQREDFPARIFHPEDVERLLEKRNETLARGKPFEVEKRELGKDGKYRWFLVRYNPLRDDQGHIIRWYATGTDIEDRKRAEESMRDENLALREQIDHAFMFEEIVGSSPALQTVLSSIVKVAPTDSTVLITGETGTGKELIARAIHKHSQRSGQAFISVNCASIPSSLIASELFGHEKGAFTGALQRRQGRFEMAHSGTIFLDEVGELPAETQIALLRVLQERQFERVGGSRVLPTDVRVIAATNSDLTAAIAAGTFRADLFYRLNVFPIEMPPLRKRKEDIPILVEYFVKRYAEKAGKQICKIDNKTLELCQSYAWPGNIRELQNIVERSVILCAGDTFWIEKAWLARVRPPRQELGGPLPDTLQNQEREIIETALAESKGKVAGPAGAAAKLGIPRSTLDSKIKQLNIKKHKFIAER